MAEFLSGKYTHQIDDRGRLRVPSKFKEIIGVKPFVTLSPLNKCLIVYSNEKAQKTIIERFENVDEFTDSPIINKMRKMLGNGAFIEEDKQGRLAVSPDLLKKAGITKNVVSIGMLNRIEIWDEEEWIRYDESVDLKELNAAEQK